MEASRDVQERCLVLGRDRTRSGSWTHRGTRNLNTNKNQGVRQLIEGDSEKTCVLKQHGLCSQGPTHVTRHSMGGIVTSMTEWHLRLTDCL